MPKVTQTAGRKQLDTFVPDFARYNDDILFGEVWSDDVLPPKEKSMIVISIFMGRGLADSSLAAHQKIAKQNGLTRKELVSLVTQGGFYAGWPMVWAVFNMAKDIWDEPEEEQQNDPALEAYAKTIFFPIGDLNPYGKWFSKRSWLAPMSDGPLPIFNVTFEPGCRNNWHIHHAKTGGGQVLICIGGRGWYQERGKDPVEMTPGTVIEIPEGVRHWHGAADDSWFSHLAFDIPGTSPSTEWLESSR